MIFVIVMEYLHRKVLELGSVPNFNFDSKCEKMSIIDLSFADDLLLFTRGDEISVQLIMDKFQEFSRETGLVVNPAKCKLFYGGMDREPLKTLLT